VLFRSATVRANAGAGWRVAIPSAVTARLDVGVDVTDVVSPVLGLSLGVEHLAQR